MPIEIIILNIIAIMFFSIALCWIMWDALFTRKTEKD